MNKGPATPVIVLGQEAAEQLQSLSDRLQASVAESAPRDAVMMALAAVIAFLDSRQSFAEEGLSSPFVALQFAINDLREGSVAPFLAPENFNNRHPEPTSKKMMKAYASVCVDYLKSKGFGVKSASVIIATALIDAGYKIEGKQGAEPWKTIKNWRDGVSKLPDQTQDRAILLELRSSFPLPHALNPDAAKRHVVQLLQALVRRVGKYALD